MPRTERKEGSALSFITELLTSSSPIAMWGMVGIVLVVWGYYGILEMRGEN